MREDGVEFEMHGGGILCLARSEEGIAWFAPVFEDLQALGFEGTIESLTLEAGARDRAVARRRRALRRAHERRSLRAPRVAHGGARREAARAGRRAARARRRDRSAPERRGLDGRDERRRGRGARRSSWPPARRRRRCCSRSACDVPIVAAKGYSLTLQGEGVAPRTALYLCEPKIGVSGYDGGVRIAGHVRAAGPHTSTSTASASATSSTTRCRSSAAGSPRPARSRRQGWAGFRPATPDSLPLLGPVPGERRPLRGRRPRHARRHARARHGRGDRGHGDHGERAGLARAVRDRPRLAGVVQRLAAPGRSAQEICQPQRLAIASRDPPGPKKAMLVGVRVCNPRQSSSTSSGVPPPAGIR